MVSQLSNNFVNPVIIISAYLNDMRVAKHMWEKIQDLSQKSNCLQNSKLGIDYFNGIELKDVAVAYKDKDVFSNVSFDIKKGEKVLIVAPSGWGKSTLLNTLPVSYTHLRAHET